MNNKNFKIRKFLVSRKDSLFQDKKGKLALGILIILVVMIFTSALILILVKSGVIAVKPGVATEPILNAEFLPAGKIGNLAVVDFEFCSFIDEDFNCLSELQEFTKNDNVYVRFLIESTTYNGDVLLIRNYRIKNPFGETILQVDQKNSYSFEVEGGGESERVVFADFFVMEDDAPLGEYTLDVIVENPLLEKRITFTQKFKLVE